MTVSDEAKVAVDRVTSHWERSQQYVVERVMTWFADQEDDVQGPILRSLPESRTRDFTRLVLERMAGSGQPDPDLPETVLRRHLPKIMSEDWLQELLEAGKHARRMMEEAGMIDTDTGKAPAQEKTTAKGRKQKSKS